MKRLSIIRHGTAIVPPPVPELIQPVPVPLPGEGVYMAHDFMCNDPRYTPDNKPFTPRVLGTKYTVPEAFQFSFSDGLPLDRGWAEFCYDVFAHYAPQDYVNRPPVHVGEDWLIGYTPKNLLDDWWLHLMATDRCYTNHMGWNEAGYRDPVTGYGPGASPMRKAGVTTGGNYFWKSRQVGEKVYVWCLDHRQAPPPFEKVKDCFWLLHIATQSSPDVVDKTPQANCPNGTWRVPRFPQGEGNAVVVPMMSREDLQTRTWNGIALRENAIPLKRCLPYPQEIGWPYVPESPLLVKG